MIGKSIRIFKNFYAFVRHMWGRISLPESVFLGLAPIIVGLLTGVGVWLCKQRINLIQKFMFNTLGNLIEPYGRWTMAVLPVAGGVVVGLISYFVIGKERYHGLPGIIEACALAGGRLPFAKMPIRVTAAALSIGSGASVGPEDPSVQVGANIGSMIGQWLHFSEERVRALVAGGAAAGIASAFNAPIAGVFFALEVLLGELSGSSFAYITISGVIASVFTQAVSGSQPAFNIPQYSSNSIWELPLYLGLGLLAGPLAAAYIQLITLSRKLFHRLAIPVWCKPALAGLMVGGVGVLLPQIFGVGYEVIGSILENNSLTVLLLLVLLIAKLILTPVSIGGGFVGGVFAPSLFLGATLGGAYGMVANCLFPSLEISMPAFAMVGMAAVLAGTVHAPLTALLLLFEMTHDYRIILPLMFAVAVSLIVARRFQKESVYQLPLVENGIRLENGRDVEVLEGITVQEVMYKDLTYLNESDTISTAVDLFSKTRRHGLPVINSSGELSGMLTLEDIEKASSKGIDEENDIVGDICTRQLETVYPDETIGTAFRRMSVKDIGRLPVVSRENPLQLIGVLRRNDMIRAYEVALTRRASLRHRTHQVRLGILSGADVHEVIVHTNSGCAAKRIIEVTWPRDCVISSIRRGQKILLPHGDTLLKPGDVLIVVTEGSGLEEVERICAVTTE